MFQLGAKENLHNNACTSDDKGIGHGGFHVIIHQHGFLNIVLEGVRAWNLADSASFEDFGRGRSGLQ